MSLLNDSQIRQPGGIPELDMDSQVPGAFLGRRADDELRATGVLAETLPRQLVTSNAVSAGSSGRLYLVPIWLPTGELNTITMFSGATASVASTHVWFSLYTLARELLGVTEDDTTTPWTANTEKALDLAAPVEISTPGWYLAGRVVVVTTTMPSLCGALSQSVINSKAPCYSGGSNTGLTDPASAPDPANAPAGLSGTPYIAVS